MHPTELGPYVITAPLGKGGMGSVYRARHGQTDEEVAVKVLSPHLAQSEGFRERFEAEIASLQTLRHAGIVRLYGHGEQDGVLFYAMELVDGPSLDTEIKQGRRFTWRETVQIAIQVSRALKHAHDHGVVHRDIKPANILLAAKGQTKLADFGIARLFGSTGVTMAGGVLGTADYMSPEQAAGEPVTARCDQYSLGGVMYALLAGRPPFRSSDLTGMLQLQRFAIPEPVKRFAPDTPVEVEQVVMQLLSKDPSKRFPNTLVLARHLEAMMQALAKPSADDFELYEGAPTAAAPDIDEARLAATQALDDGGTPPAESLEGSASESISLLSDATPSASQAENNRSSSPSSTIVAENRYTDVTTASDTAPTEWRSLLGLVALLVMASAMILGAVWWWTSPLGVDALYQRIEDRHARGDSGRAAERDIAQFVTRFPDDDRAAEVAGWGRELELNRLRKQVALAQLGGQLRGEAQSAEEVLLRRAAELGQEDRTAGAEAFDNLADLLTIESGADTDEDEAERLRSLGQLARHEALRLRSVLEEERQHVLDFARKRFDAAQAMLDTQPARSAKIARALVATIDRDDQTADLLDRAARLAEEADQLALRASGPEGEQAPRTPGAPLGESSPAP